MRSEEGLIYSRLSRYDLLYAETSTLQDFYARQGIPAIPVDKLLWAWMFSNATSYFFILTNLANYRKIPPVGGARHRRSVYVAGLGNGDAAFIRRGIF